MHTVDELRIRANGLEFAALSQGEGPLVLLLHGFPDRADSWRPVMAGLAAAGFRAVAPHLRGYGDTEIPASGDYRVPTLGRDALALIAALDADQAVVVGHDWGASAAYAAANLDDDDRVIGLCALAIPHPRIIKPSLGLLLRARHFVVFQLGAIGRWWARRRDYAYIDYLYRYWSPTWAEPQGHIDAVKADLRRPGRLEAALRYYAQIPAGLKKTEDNRRLRAPTAQPTLLFAGLDDGALRIAKDFRGIEACFTGPMRLVEVEGAGHFIPAEKPQMVIDALVPFLKGLPWR